MSSSFATDLPHSHPAAVSDYLHFYESSIKDRFRHDTAPLAKASIGLVRSFAAFFGHSTFFSPARILHPEYIPPRFFSFFVILNGSCTVLCRQMFHMPFVS